MSSRSNGRTDPLHSTGECAVSVQNVNCATWHIFREHRQATSRCDLESVYKYHYIVIFRKKIIISVEPNILCIINLSL